MSTIVPIVSAAQCRRCFRSTVEPRERRNFLFNFYDGFYDKFAACALRRRMKEKKSFLRSIYYFFFPYIFSHASPTPQPPKDPPKKRVQRSFHYSAVFVLHGGVFFFQVRPSTYPPRQYFSNGTTWTICPFFFDQRFFFSLQFFVFYRNFGFFCFFVFFLKRWSLFLKKSFSVRVSFFFF